MAKISARATWGLRAAIGAMLLAVGAVAGVSAMRSGDANPAIPSHGNIFQSGAMVAWASGARISAHDRSVVEFDQIEHARQLAQQNEFEYGGVRMRISQVKQVDYLPSRNSATSGSTARPDKTLVRVTAKIQPSR
jgi:hypothetical protein